MNKINCKDTFNKYSLKYFIIVVICLGLIPTQIKAQVSSITGINYSKVRNSVLENEGPIYTPFHGVAVNCYFLKCVPQLSIRNELFYTIKGYEQGKDAKHQYTFSYLSAPVLFNYQFISEVSVHTGIEPSILLFTNIEKGYKTYNHKDLAIVLGMSFFETKRVSLFLRYSYGLIPMLDYYRFDKLGNFTGEIHDLKNTCLSLGIKIDLCHEKICFFQ